MTLSVEMVTFDCSDPARLAGWWAEHFGGTAHELLPGEFIAVTRPAGPRLGFQKVPDPTPGKKTGCTWTFRPPTWTVKCHGWRPPERPRYSGINSGRTSGGW